MSDQEYFAHPYTNASTLKIFSGPESKYSKRQALHKLETPREPSPAMSLGSLFHQAMEIGYLDVEPCPFDDFRTKAAREWRDNHVGPIYTQKDIDTANCMMESVKRSAPYIWDLARHPDGVREKEVFNDDKKLKCKEDLFLDGIIYDWKSCKAITPYDIRRACDFFHYDLQAAHYLETDVEAENFIFVFVQSEAPFEVVIVPGGSILERGRKKWEIAFKRYKTRLEGVLEAVTVDPSWEQMEQEEENLDDVTI